MNRTLSVMKMVRSRMVMQKNLLLILVAISVFASAPATGQSINSAPRANPELWRSHQMNQPTPAANEKDVLSDDRLEEIRQLYMEAKREAETGQPSENRKVPALNHQMK